MNDLVFDVLKNWIKQTKHLESSYLFPSPQDPQNHIKDIKSAWNTFLGRSKDIRRRAQDKEWLKDFVWHDLRHDFASKLVMAGVDLNTVRVLMGHSDIKMTLRYAHLAPDHLQNSVAKLLGK